MAASISASSKASYYFQPEQLKYRLSGAAGIATWYGNGAQALGFRGAVTLEALANAYDGLSPDGRRQLVQAQRHENRQSAWDMTFSAPKPVSTLWTVVDGLSRQVIEDAVLSATKTALDYLESVCIFTRRGKGGTAVERAKGVFALFLHNVSRALDPQLHVHALTINLGARMDGTTGTIRSRDLYQHKMAAGALFRLELAQLLERKLGLIIQQDGWSFRIKGVPDALCNSFSKRRHQIEELARKGMWVSPEALAAVTRSTREAKRDVPLSVLLSEWRDEAQRHGFTPAQAQKLVRGTQAERTRAWIPQRHIPQAIDRLASHKAYFPERDVIKEVAGTALGTGVSAGQLLQDVRHGLNALEYRVDKATSLYTHYSTNENVEAEKQLLKNAGQGRWSLSHVLQPDAVERAKVDIEMELTRELSQPIRLTEDQTLALHHITTKPGDLVVVQGYAGTGKTQMLRAADAAWTRNGHRVIGAAITGRAASGLEQASGIKSYTIDSLLNQLRPKSPMKVLAREAVALARDAYYEGIRAGQWMKSPLRQSAKETSKLIAERFAEQTRGPLNVKLDAKTILVVDEAAMLSTQHMLAIQEECKAADAKLVLIGDQLQLPSVEAGGPFGSLAKRLGHCSLTTIMRQKLPWMREAVSDLIANEPLLALERYAENGALRLADTPLAALEELVRDYSAIPSSSYEKAIALTATNYEALVINCSMQAVRKSQGELGLAWLTLPSGESVHVNDRVMLTRNDYGFNVRNGMLGTVTKLEHRRGIMGPGAITIQLDETVGPLTQRKRTVVLDTAYYPHVRLGYAATAFKVQGITVEQSFVLLGDSMLSKERAFTQLTRASHQTTIYGTQHLVQDDPLVELARQMSKETAKDLAHDHTLTRKKGMHYDNSLSL